MKNNKYLLNTINRATFIIAARNFIFLIAVALSLMSIGEACRAADFNLGNPGIELRRLQICPNCSKHLVVTSIAPGAAVRCPHCGHVQRRLPDSELLIKVYQICPSCSQRLDVSGLDPMEAFKCGSCGFEQRVLPEAAYKAPSNAGRGRIPAKTTIAATPKLLPKKTRKLPEPVVPGLNSPEQETTQDFKIDIKEESTNSNQAPAPTKNTKKQTGIHEKTHNNSQQNSKIKTQGSYLNLPKIDSNIKGKITIQVNGEAVYESTIMRRVLSKLELYQIQNPAKINPNEQQKLYQSMRIESENELIDEELIRQEAAREGIHPSKDLLIKTINNSQPRLNEKEAYTTIYKAELLKKHTATWTSPSTSELLRYYSKNIHLFSSPDQLIIDSIVIYNDREGRSDTRNVKTITDEIKEKLNFDVDFSVLAKRYSEGPFNKDGGRVRRVNSTYIPANNLLKPLRDYQYSLKSGDTFGPLELPSCNLFVKIFDVKRGKAQVFETVKKDVEKAVIGNSRDSEFRKWLDSIRRAAVVEYTK